MQTDQAESFWHMAVCCASEARKYRDRQARLDRTGIGDATATKGVGYEAETWEFAARKALSWLDANASLPEELWSLFRKHKTSMQDLGLMDSPLEVTLLAGMRPKVEAEVTRMRIRLLELVLTSSPPASAHESLQLSRPGSL